MAVSVEEFIPSVSESPQMIVRSDKFKQEFYIRPSIGGFVFYSIFTSKGKVPDELSGQYTSMLAALKALKKYEHKQPLSKAVQRDNYAAKAQRDSKEHVRTGTDNGEG